MTVTPGPSTKQRWSRTLGTLSAVLALLGALVLVFTGVAANADVHVYDGKDKIYICHHDNGAKVYNYIDPDINSIVKSNGHGEHTLDIIPAFSYYATNGTTVLTFPGVNTGSLSVLASECSAVPPLTPVTPVTPAVTQSRCVDGEPTTSSYTLTAITGVIYKDGTTVVSGTVPAAAGSSVTVDADPAEGYVLSGTTSWVLHFDRAPECSDDESPRLSGTVGKSSDADGDLSWTNSETTTAAPGSAVTFRAVVTNTSGVTVNVGALSDSYGSGPTTITPTCAATPPATLANNASFTCEFTVSGYTPAVGSSLTDTFSATLSRTGSASITLSGQATVRTLGSSGVVKTNDANGDTTYSENEEAATPGQDVVFKLHITNANPWPVTVGGVLDFIGTDEGIGVNCLTSLPEGPALTLAAGASGDCFFKRLAYSPPDGQSKADYVTLTLTEVVPIHPSGLRRTRTRAAVHIAARLTPLTSNRSTVRTRVPVVIIPNNPGSPDLKVVKSGPASVNPGGSLAYTLTVTNTGTAAATTGHVADTMPSGVTLVSLAGAGFTCAAGVNVSCDLSSPLAAGASATLTVAATLSSTYSAATVVNTAVVTPTDNTPGDNSSDATTQVTNNDLGLTKSGPASAKPGDEIVYTLTVTNVKGAAATGFTVTDQLPAGLAFSGASGTGFTCSENAGTISCDYTGSLAPGASAQVVVRALLLETFTGTEVVNTGVLTPGRSDGDPGNNSGSATTAVEQPAPITGVGGGGAQAPSPSPTPAASGGGGGGGGATGLPFTGTYADRLLGIGVALLVLGLFLALAARRRPDTSE